MDNLLSKSSRTKPSAPLPPTKRISTPAGQRLSVILDNHDAVRQQSARSSYRSSLKKPGLGATPRESPEEAANAYMYGIRPDTSPPPSYQEKLFGLRNNEHLAKRGGWTRLVLILGLVLVIVVGVVVGVMVGLSKKSGSSSPADPSTDSVNTGDSPSPTNAVDPESTGIQGATPVVPGSPSSSSTSARPEFPAGSYTLSTFLDTVQTNCTSNPATWTCYPYTIYNDSPTRALTPFQWIISRSGPSYQISSTTNPFAISFSGVPLQLITAGQDSEHYRFQITVPKEVTPSAAITDDGTATTCVYESTTFTAYLYTKRKKDYPAASPSTSGGGAYAEWPYAVRVEQVAAGGEGTLECYRMADGRRGEQVTEGLTPQDAGSLCSCLYRNYLTRKP